MIITSKNIVIPVGIKQSTLFHIVKNEWQTQQKVSLYNRSVHWLCTLLTVMKLFLSVPLARIIALATSTFSPPLSDHTLNGQPNILTAHRKKVDYYSALLLQEACKYTILWEKTSMQPWMTIQGCIDGFRKQKAG